MTQFTAIDLSKLPIPDVIAPLDYDTILDDYISRFQALFPDYVIVESDWVIKAFEVAASIKLAERAAYNVDNSQNYIALATGANLDGLAANLLTTRLAGESDDALRKRAVLAPEAFSTAGPEGAYIYHAKSAHSDIENVGVTSPDPGVVQVVILSKNGVPNQEILDAVADRLDDEDVRPITDYVQILPVTLVDFVVDGVIYTFAGPDSAVVIQTALANLNEYLAASRLVGEDISLSGIYASLHVAGVKKVTLSHPTSDIAISDLQCGRCTNINVTWGGINA